ncbi:MAG: GtrA family protein [Candidatus Thiodiazotropha sp.]|jgi:putative flippase GtrA
MLSVKLFRQVFYFGVVGISATLTNYLIAVLCYEYVGLNIYASQLVGYCLAVMVSLFGHSKFTFNTQLTTGVFLRFITVSLTTLALSEVLLHFLETSFSLSHRVSLMVVVIFIPVITFFLSKLWVFSERKNA